MDKHGALSFFLFYLLCSIFIITIFSPTVAAQDTWWDSNWSYRKSHTITSTNSSTDYQIKIKIFYDSGNSNGDTLYINRPDVKSDFSDIRFLSSSGQKMSYWIESKVDGQYAIIWVKIPQLNIGINTIYVYYGNPNVSICKPTIFEES